MSQEYKKAVLAGGCFWGLEDLLQSKPGVIEIEAGYTGGVNENPTYESHPGHAEAIEITYDPKVTSYKQILDFFFQIHNPTTLNQQERLIVRLFSLLMKRKKTSLKK